MMKGEIDILGYCPNNYGEVVFVDLPFPERTFPKNASLRCDAYPTPRGVIIFNAVLKDYPGHFQLQVVPTRSPDLTALEICTFIKQNPNDENLVSAETIAQIKPLISNVALHALQLPPIETLLKVIKERGLN